MAITDKQFSTALMLWKALVTFGKTSAASGIAAAIALEVANVPLPATIEEAKAQWPIFIAPLVLGIVKGVNNWRKNKGVSQ